MHAHEVTVTVSTRQCDTRLSVAQKGVCHSEFHVSWSVQNNESRHKSQPFLRLLFLALEWIIFLRLYIQILNLKI